MPYSEYFNYDNALHKSIRYANYGNSGATHTNYSDHHSYHRNTYGLGCATYHSSYGDYHAAHYNYNNHQTNAHYNYKNHINYSAANKGVPMNLTWSSPWDGDDISATYIAESIDAIKQLRDKLKFVDEHRSHAETTVDVAPDSARVGDQRFQAGSKIDDDQYDAIKESLDNLWATIKGDDDSTTPEAPNRDAGDPFKKSDWIYLKQKIDALAEYDDSADYSNLVSKSKDGTYHTNHYNYWNSGNVPYMDIGGYDDYTNYGDYSDYSNAS